jgi:hypothetical protein
MDENAIAAAKAGYDVALALSALRDTVDWIARRPDFPLANHDEQCRILLRDIENLRSVAAGIQATFGASYSGWLALALLHPNGTEPRGDGPADICYAEAAYWEAFGFFLWAMGISDREQLLACTQRLRMIPDSFSTDALLQPEGFWTLVERWADTSDSIIAPLVAKCRLEWMLADSTPRDANSLTSHAATRISDTKKTCTWPKDEEGDRFLRYLISNHDGQTQPATHIRKYISKRKIPDHDRDNHESLKVRLAAVATRYRHQWEPSPVG